MIGLEVVALAATLSGGGSANAVEHSMHYGMSHRHDGIGNSTRTMNGLAENRHGSAAEALEGLPVHYRAAFDDGRITVVLDQNSYDFHIDAEPDYSASHMTRVLRRLDAWGYELMMDETELEIFEDGTVRKYLVPFTTREV